MGRGIENSHRYFYLFDCGRGTATDGRGFFETGGGR
jgi:hypothetical protein